MLVAAITGSGDITENNASALLDDYLPEDVLVYVPSYMTSDGMRVVVQWLKSANINIERVKKPLMSSFLLANSEADERVLIVLGVSGSEDIILECIEESVPVLDLTRGLFQVTREEASETEMPLSEPESDGETLSPAPGTPMIPRDAKVLESLTEPQPGITSESEALVWAVEEVKKLRKEVSTLRAAAVSGEVNWEPSPQSDPSIATGAGFAIGDSTEGKIRCYQNGKNKVRKAGRSKIKPGEKEVWLTEEEFESLTS
jgi:hypothetical protein